MTLKFALSAVVFLAAAPALAQPPAAGGAAAQPAQPSPAAIAAIQTAGQAFGTCVSGGMQNVPASATPEAGAAGVLSGCAAQRTALVQAVEAMIATMPADQAAAARAQMDSQLGQVPTQLADGIRQQRAAAAAAAAAPAATPATPATPPPH